LKAAKPPAEALAHSASSTKAFGPFFDSANAPRRARILLAEKGISHNTVIVDMMSKEQIGEAYRAINPLCTIPALRLAGCHGARKRQRLPHDLGLRVPLSCPSSWPGRIF
jgi:hypothetical protein